MRAPKVNMFNNQNRCWQTIKHIEFVKLDEQQMTFFVHFKDHWENYNLVQQFRRAAQAPTLGIPKKVELTVYGPGKKTKSKFLFKIAGCWVIAKIVHLSGIVTELESGRH